MKDIPKIINAANRSDPQAAAELLPLVYDELRKLAAARLVHEKPGQTLNATALVHEAYLRLVGDQEFKDRGHFFAAAAEAIRRILVESARRKSRLKRGGDGHRVELPDDLPAPAASMEDVLAVDEALDQLAERDPTAATLVKLHYFGGFTLKESADLLGVPHRTAYRTWSFARAWLFRNLARNGAPEVNPPAE